MRTARWSVSRVVGDDMRHADHDYDMLVRESLSSCEVLGGRTEQRHFVLTRVTPPSPVLPRGLAFFDEDDSSNYSCPTLEEELDTELPSRGAVLRRE